MKVAIAPTVIILEVFMFRKIPSLMVLLSVLVVCAGVTIATVTDPIVVDNSLGLAVGVAGTPGRNKGNNCALSISKDG